MPIQTLMKGKLMIELMSQLLAVIAQSSIGVEHAGRACYSLAMLFRKLLDVMFDFVDSVKEQAATKELEDQRQEKLRKLRGIFIFALMILCARVVSSLTKSRLAPPKLQAIRRVEHQTKHLAWQQEFMVDRRKALAPMRQNKFTVMPKL
jgi:hypothetical protein